MFVMVVAARIGETASADGCRCSSCGKGCKEGTILLCDVCGAGRHVKCLPTEMVPDWHDADASYECAACAQQQQQQQRQQQRRRQQQQRRRRQSSPCHLPGERVEALYNGKWYGCTVVRMRATDADVAVDGGEWTVEVATEMRAATAAVPSQTQQLAEVSGLRWVGETPPAIAIAECEKAEGARAEGGERKRKREGCGL